MIIDLQKFLATERAYWSQLERMLAQMENNPELRMTVDEMKKFHYLYQRASADLAKIRTFCSEPDLQRYVETLVARAYGEVHATADRSRRFRPLTWFFQTFPQTFRRHVRPFWLSFAVMFAGALFGAFALAVDEDAKAVLVPFSHLLQSPADRVRQEEQSKDDRLEGNKARFSTHLMQNNITVSIRTFAFGMTWGIGTIVSLFYNGVILGAVAFDYIRDGQTIFLLGWLLPHGSIELPAIILAGQAGLVLAGTLIGRASRDPLKVRLRKVAPDLVTLIGGIAIMLVWAGIIEAFLSQYHAPALPYEAKIAFGAVELILLCVYLAKSGSRSPSAVAVQ
jgi:uncharacterized membrane protein SpoIIM required for sporulation